MGEIAKSRSELPELDISPARLTGQVPYSAAETGLGSEDLC